MDIKVLEGSLVEVPAAGITGMDRRAFGEFIGPRGELVAAGGQGVSVWAEGR